MTYQLRWWSEWTYAVYEDDGSMFGRFVGTADARWDFAETVGAQRENGPEQAYHKERPGGCLRTRGSRPNPDTLDRSFS